MAIVSKPTASGDTGGGLQTASAVVRDLPNDETKKKQVQAKTQEKNGAIGAMLEWFADSLGLSNEDKQHLVTGGESALAGNSSPDVPKVTEVAKDQAAKVAGIDPKILGLAGREGSVFKNLAIADASPAARFDCGVSAGRMQQQIGMALA